MRMHSGQSKMLWTLQGLPQDKTAVENAAILSTSARTPLVIDPDLHFTQWIMEKSSSGKLQRETAGSKTLKQTLLQAVEFGWNLVVDRIEKELEPILLQAAAKQVQPRRGRAYGVRSEKHVDLYRRRYRDRPRTGGDAVLGVQCVKVYSSANGESSVWRLHRSGRVSPLVESEPPRWSKVKRFISALS